MTSVQNLWIPVYDQMRMSLANGTWARGDFLSLRKVAKEMKVSQTPVREAFRQLESEGLVETVYKKGIRPKEMSREEVKELFEMRTMLESGAAQLAAKAITQEQLHELTAILKEESDTQRQIRDELRKTDSPEPWPGKAYELRLRHLEANFRFHLGIVKAAGNKLLAKTMGNYHILTRLLYSHAVLPNENFAKRAAKDYAFHRRTLRALKNRDGETAAKFLSGHVKDAMSFHLKRYDWEQTMIEASRRTHNLPADFLSSIERVENRFADEEKSTTAE